MCCFVPYYSALHYNVKSGCKILILIMIVVCQLNYVNFVKFVKYHYIILNTR